MLVKRNYVSFPIGDNQIEFIKQQMLTWAAPFNICCFLDNHDYNSGTSSLHSVECLLAAGAAATLKASAGEGLNRLKEWAATQQDWLFGHFAYDLVTETEPVHVTAPMHPGFAAPNGSVLSGDVLTAAGVGAQSL